MTKDKKKLHDVILFGEQDNITPENSTESLTEDDASLRLLRTQEMLLSNYDLMQKKMDASAKLIACLSKNLVTLKDNQDKFVKHITDNYFFHFDISQKSLALIRTVFSEEVNEFRRYIHNSTTSEINRLRKAFGDEENKIDVIRLRWWPHVLILIMVIYFLVCSDILLLLKVMGKL